MIRCDTNSKKSKPGFHLASVLDLSVLSNDDGDGNQNRKSRYCKHFVTILIFSRSSKIKLVGTALNLGKIMNIYPQVLK